MMITETHLINLYAATFATAKPSDFKNIESMVDVQSERYNI